MRSYEMMVVGGLVLTVLGSLAHGAVLCERKGKLRLRAEACKPKETPVQDLTALEQAVAESGTQAASVASDLDAIDGEFRIACVGAPALVFAPSPKSFYFDDIECSGGCRTHDGNQAACEAAFALAEDGATSCIFAKGLCVPCADCGFRSGLCTNACRVSTATCAGDPTRTVRLIGDDPCRSRKTQVACEQAFHVSRRRSVASCFWDGSDCRGCGFRKEQDGDCTNTCVTATCADASRTVFGQCSDTSDSVECAKRWHIAGAAAGEPSSCWFDAADNQCRGCGLVLELTGDCDNTCRAGS